LLARIVNGFIFIKQNELLKRILKKTPDWITPNRITKFRILLAAPTIYCLSQSQWWSAAIISGTSLLLDFIDGALAEAKNLKTEEGTKLDPLADKIFVIATAVTLLWVLTGSILYIIAGVIAVEIAIAGIRLIASKIKRVKVAKQVLTAEWSGKLKMVLESFGLVIIILSLALSSSIVFFIGGALLALSIPFGCVSLFTKIAQVKHAHHISRTKRKTRYGACFRTKRLRTRKKHSKKS